MTKAIPNSDQIAIVDAQDIVIGAQDRQIARQQGLIHRISKVFIINPSGEILIHQRSASRSDNPLKWDCSAAGHVDAGEDYLDAAHRETLEEIGISNLTLNYIGKYYYVRQTGAFMLRRFNAVFLGRTAQEAVLNPIEVAQIHWITPTELQTWLASRPEDFTTSFREIIEQFGNQILHPKNR